MKKYLSVFAIFLGSFLVFGVQPMVGRTLLPIFGGTAAVWVVCLCAFQMLLLAGYFYADLMGGRVTKQKVLLHTSLLILSSVLTAVIALTRDSLLPHISFGIPSVDVLLSVVLLTGFSYVLLSSNSSLVQSISSGDGVYKLYAVSNLGSLLGLLAYPFVFEPYVGVTHQWIGFACGIAFYAFLLYSLMNKSRVDSCKTEEESSCCDVVNANIKQSLLFAVIPAVSCFLLNALTTHVTLDVMPMPLIWTGALALYLASYIVGFSGVAAKVVRFAGVVSAILLAAVCWMHGKPVYKIGLPIMLVVFGGLLFMGCTFLHGWLYLIRPKTGKKALTRYYLFQAIGGAIGGSVASIGFPLVCDTVLEYPVSLAVLGISLIVGLGIMAKLVGCRRVYAYAPAVLVAMISAYAWFMYETGVTTDSRTHIYRGRGFFGTVDVLEVKAKTSSGEGRVHEYVHGSTVHGIQALIPGKERMATCYYTMNASGYAIVGHPKYRKGEPMRVNITGLGIGVLFSYGRKGDYYRAYEISKDALDVATNTNLFTFVSDCPAKKDIVLGDARKGLEAELAAGVEPYDVIVVDAFTGDNVPYHLSTIEAFDLYFKLLKPDGILCVNISNWHLDLYPFLRALGDYYNCPLMGLTTSDNHGTLQFAARIGFFCRNPSGMAPPPIGNHPLQSRMIDFSKITPMKRLPTDEKGSFVSLIRW